MRYMHALLCAALIFLLLASVTLGQGAPSQIDAALLDLSARLGHSIGIGNLSNWRWEQQNFADASLNCPTAEGSGGGAVLGYQFELTYNAIIYDYRVSADNAIVILCGQLDPDRPIATPDPATQYSNRLCSATATDGPYMRSRINAGMEIEVAGGYLNLRGQPSANGQVLLQIPAGLPFAVTGGPDCVDGYVWWLVIVNGQTGYIAESGGGAYFVQPKRPAAMPSREVLNTSLAPLIGELAKVSGNFQPQHAWTSDGSFIALPGAVGSESIWLYDLRHQILSPQILEFDAGISALEFRPNGTQLLFGGDSGRVYLWQIMAGAALSYSERLFLNSHASAISALAFSADGNRFVSAGSEAYTHVQVDRNWAAINWDLPTVAQQAVLSGHNGLIRALAFAPTEAIIVTGADDNRVKFWDANSGVNTSTRDVGAPTTALDYSPDGELLALGLSRTSDNLLLLQDATGSPLASYRLPTNSVTSLDFSPDGSMLVVGAAEGIFSVWDTATHQMLVAQSVDGRVYDVSFSPDGSLIAVSTDKYALSFYGVRLGSG